jgi:hypothetical protein
MATDDKLASEEGPTGLNIIDLFVELIEDSLDGIQFGSQDTDDCYLKGISRIGLRLGMRMRGMTQDGFCPDGFLSIPSS